MDYAPWVLIKIKIGFAKFPARAFKATARRKSLEIYCSYHQFGKVCVSGVCAEHWFEGLKSYSRICSFPARLSLEIYYWVVLIFMFENKHEGRTRLFEVISKVNKFWISKTDIDGIKF